MYYLQSPWKDYYDKIISFVSQSISPSQFVFRPKHFTLQQLLLFVNGICESFSSKSQTDVIYLDFKKAFDSIAHNELLVKLWSFGITGNLWWWFRGYLSSRHQCVIINHCISDPLPVISGVHQGSILGPLLFLNDLPTTVSSSHTFLFADDTKCLQTVRAYSDCHSLIAILCTMLFFIRCLKDPVKSNAFSISSYVTFCASSTRSSTHFKLKHSLSRINTSILSHFYFNRLPRLWNSLPAINLNQSTSSIRKKLMQFLWNHFMCHFRSDSPCTLHFLCPCAKCLCLPITYNDTHSSL